VLCSFLRIDDPVDPGIPQKYRERRIRKPSRSPRRSARQAAGPWQRKPTCQIRPPRLRADLAEEQLGPVDILINNATGRLADTFAPVTEDRMGRALQPVSVATWRQQFGVDALAAALLIAEFARRHVASGASWGRIIGLTSGGELGFPEEVSYGAAKAAQTNYTMSAAAELAPFGIMANMVHHLSPIPAG
jgi:3-oxoacyl-[acyl-carrier protein] reductase